MQEKLATASPHHFLATYALLCMEFNRLDTWWLMSPFTGKVFYFFPKLLHSDGIY